ncbi:hypothetical protein FRC17_008579, partial [Serendipita sp. 399]
LYHQQTEICDHRGYWPVAIHRYLPLVLSRECHPSAHSDARDDKLDLDTQVLLAITSGEPDNLALSASPLVTSTRRKYIWLSINTVVFVVHGVSWVLLRWVHLRPREGEKPWYLIGGLQFNRNLYKGIHQWDRSFLDRPSVPLKQNIAGFALVLPFAGIHTSLYFGLASEAQIFCTTCSRKLAIYLRGTKLYTFGDILVGKITRLRQPPADHLQFTPYYTHDVVLSSRSSLPKNQLPLKTSLDPLPQPPPRTYKPPEAGPKVRQEPQTSYYKHYSKRRPQINRDGLASQSTPGLYVQAATFGFSSSRFLLTPPV